MLSRLFITVICIFFAPATFAQIVQRFDIIIDEIMADPAPSVGMPNAEYIELRNNSGRLINLLGFRLVTSGSQSGSFPAYNLPADSFVVITSTANAPVFAFFGRSLGVTSFPSLDNDGTIVSLISKEGAVVHAVQYDRSWYGNAVRSEGGWSLEMIDPQNPCSGKDNWGSSSSMNGGSPGKKNSIDAMNVDDAPPQLLRSFSMDSITVVAIFNEPVDSISASDPAKYKIDGTPVSIAKPIAPLFDRVQLKVAMPLQKRKVAFLEVTGITDCSGNTTGIYNKVKAGVDEIPLKGDIVINEILFNPKPGGSDFVEILNNSDKIFDLSKLYLSNHNSFKKISEKEWFFFPGAFVVVTGDVPALQRQYFLKDPFAVHQVTGMPSFADYQGEVKIMDGLGNGIDTLTYTEKWHFALISNPEGVSLERVDPGKETLNPGNWHSASSTSGYGTPGYKNSQFRNAEKNEAVILIDPPVFSPGNDGDRDFVYIRYRMASPGFIASVKIFDQSGNPVKTLVRNHLLGLEGYWRWEGLDEKQQFLPKGLYVISTEIFNLDGKRKHYKNMVVIAGKK